MVVGRPSVGGASGKKGDMAKPKRKLTKAEKAEKKRRREKYMTIFVNGKQKRVKRPAMIDGMLADEYISMNADPIWLLQNEMYEELYAREMEQNASYQTEDSKPKRKSPPADDDLELPF